MFSCIRMSDFSVESLVQPNRLFNRIVLPDVLLFVIILLYRRQQDTKCIQILYDKFFSKK